MSWVQDYLFFIIFNSLTNIRPIIGQKVNHQFVLNSESYVIQDKETYTITFLLDH